jgi:hypothetical protein
MTIPFICTIWGALGRCYRSCESLYTLMSQSRAKMLTCGNCQRPGEGWRPPEHAPGTASHPMLSGGPGGARWPCHCSLQAVHCSPLEQIATAARLPEQGSKRGQWAVGTCACCEGATSASPAVRGRLANLLEIVRGCLGATRDRARVLFAYSLSLLIRSLR